MGLAGVPEARDGRSTLRQRLGTQDQHAGGMNFLNDIRGLLRGEATAFQAAKVGLPPTVRSSSTAPPVTRWGFRLRKLEMRNVQRGHESKGYFIPAAFSASDASLTSTRNKAVLVSSSPAASSGLDAMVEIATLSAAAWWIFRMVVVPVSRAT